MSNVNSVFQPYQQPPVGWVSGNFYDRCLSSDRDYMGALEKAGGLIGLCCPSSYAGTNPPYTVMPPGGRRFQEIQSVNLTAITETVEADVLSFLVPTGYDGVFVAHFQLALTATPLAQGSGDATWRIKLNRRYVRNYSNMKTELGALSSPATLYRGGVRLVSQQLVKYTVTLATGAKARLGTGTITCGLQGWYYAQAK